MRRTSSAVLLAVWAMAAGAQEVMRVVVPSTVACKTKDDRELVQDMFKVKDHEAIAKMILAGRCVLLKQGAQVGWVEGSGMFGWLTRVRPRGMTEAYWVPYEHVK